MMNEYEPRHRLGGTADATDAPSPGKRALTDRLPPAASLRGHERAVASIDPIGEYEDSRATIDGPPRDPLDFLDDEAQKHHPHRHHHQAHGQAHGQHAHGGTAHGQHAHGGHAHQRHAAPAAGTKPAARTLIGDITNLEPAGDGAVKTRVVVGIGTSHGVTEAATFQLCFPDGRPYGAAGLTVLERNRITTALGSHFAEQTFPHDTRVLVTIPPAAEPDLHPDGSVGADDMSRLEA